MSYTQPELDALDRLGTFYNGNAFDAGTNPGGMAEGGHRQNFDPSLKDTATIGAAIARLITEVDAPDLVVRSDEFRKRFLGAFGAAPNVDGNGDPVSEGALYWALGLTAFRVWNGANWVAPVASAADYVPESGGTFTGPVTHQGADIFDAAVSFNNGLSGDLTGSLTGFVTGNVNGNSQTASRLQTVRQIALSGGATGAVNFDGSANVAIPVTVTDDSHAHTLSTITDAGSMAAQNSSNVAITGGAINGTPIGQATAQPGKFTMLEGTVEVKAPKIAGGMIADSPKLIARTSNEHVVTPLGADELIEQWIADRRFISAAQTAVASGELTLTHNLGAQPTNVRVYMKCTSVDGGWSVGTILWETPRLMAYGSNSYGIEVDSTSTSEIKVYFGNYGPSGGLGQHRRKDSTGGFYPAAGKWDLFFIVEAF